MPFSTYSLTLFSKSLCLYTSVILLFYVVSNIIDFDCVRGTHSLKYYKLDHLLGSDFLRVCAGVSPLQSCSILSKETHLRTRCSGHLDRFFHVEVLTAKFIFKRSKNYFIVINLFLRAEVTLFSFSENYGICMGLGHSLIAINDSS